MNEKQHSQHGLTLTEVLVAMALLSAIIVPAVGALHSGIAGTAIHSDVATAHNRLETRINELANLPFLSLTEAAAAAGSPGNASSYSETSGLPGQLIVYLSLYDGDNADSDNDPMTGGDAGLIWIRVESEGTVHAIETVIARGQ